MRITFCRRCIQYIKLTVCGCIDSADHVLPQPNDERRVAVGSEGGLVRAHRGLEGGEIAEAYGLHEREVRALSRKWLGSG